MKKRTKLTTLLLLAAAGTTLLSGCGQKQPGLKNITTPKVIETSTLYGKYPSSCNLEPYTFTPNPQSKEITIFIDTDYATISDGINYNTFPCNSQGLLDKKGKPIKTVQIGDSIISSK